MIRVEEISIGDWVNIPNYYWDESPHVGQVDGIVKKHGTYYLQFSDAFSAEIDRCKPIPITPEILEKNGFVVNKRIYPYPYYEYINKEDELKVGFAFPQGNRTSYNEPWVYIDSEYVLVEHLPCIYVHELQHALKLCGISKNIEL